MKTLICIFLSFAIPVYGQLIFSFENEDLSEWQQVPGERWERSSENALSGAYSLHHMYDNPGAGTDYISRNFEYPDLSDTLEFSFMVRHAYNPSSGNNWQVFLLASGEDGAEPGIAGHSAILVGVNYDCSDDLLKVWQLRNGQVFEVCSSAFNYQERVGTSAAASFSLTRTPEGRWELSYNNVENEASHEMLASGLEVAAPTGKYSGIRYSYSSAQDRKLWIDDFSVDGEFFRDTLPPGILTFDVFGLNALILEFTENIRPPLATDFTWDKLHPDSIFCEGSKVVIFFSGSFPNRKTQQLKISGINDLEGNVMQDSILEFRQNLAEFGDLVINEVMPDPEPVVYLPPCEYIEVWNRSQFPVQLEEWRIGINKREYNLKNHVLQAGKFLLLTSENCGDRYSGVEYMDILSASSALPNTGGTIQLYDQYGRLIHQVEYFPAAYYGEDSEGGWSLERTDPGNICGGAENWNISCGWKGGTPGEVNSMNTEVPDNVAPVLRYMGMPDSTSISATFSESLLLSEDCRTEFYFQGKPVYFEFPPGSFVGASIELFTGEILAPARSYEIQINGAEDCLGNGSQDMVRRIHMPIQPAPGMVLFSEIMYDAFSGASEYFELINAGDDFIDLYNLKIGISDPGYPIGSSLYLSEDSHLVEPGGLVVFCKYSSSLRREWDLTWDIDVVELADWKTLPNSASCITLQDRSGKEIDKICYNDSLHSDLLSSTSGVALERITSATCPSASSCWISAATSVNYGTPGTKNSQWMESGEQAEKPFLSPRVFSPDQDGYEDMLEIVLPAYTQSSLVEITITDLDGFLLRSLIGKGFSGHGDRYFWNGEDDDGHVVFPGIYIVHIKFSSSRGTKTYREACAVRYR